MAARLSIHAKITKTRGEKIAYAECYCMVDGKKASNAELMFTIADAKDITD